MKQYSELHKGHRQRMRKRFEESGGLSAFSEHEILEMLLYSFIPRKNTNEIAHSLLKTFLTIDNVLNADVKALEEVKGISHNTAVGISFLKEFFNYYSTKALEHICISDRKQLETLLRLIYQGINVEVVKAICVDDSLNVKKVEDISVGSEISSTADISKIAKVMLNCNCSKLILVHNHPEKTSIVSRRDLITTKKISTALDMIGMKLIDHYIVAETEILSMAENGMISEI
ncbi:MAG: RadC family protein [Ruminococcus sp.]|nr:RadC family protein [Ruminococcus sp.]